MTRLVVDGVERPDTWVHLTGSSEAPADRDFTVGIARWLDQRDELLAHVERTGRRLGVRLAIDSDPMRLAADIERLDLVTMAIPSSADGRFFSIAARLREHLRYRGELRVTGDVAPDQLSFMQRCGINAFELGEHVDIERFIHRYRRFYQSSGSLTTRENLIPAARTRVDFGVRTPSMRERWRKGATSDPMPRTRHRRPPFSPPSASRRWRTAPAPGPSAPPPRGRARRAGRPVPPRS